MLTLKSNLILSDDKKTINKKFDSSDDCQIELERSKEAYTLAKETTLFSVPAIKDHTNTSIQFEFISDGIMFSQLIESNFEKAKSMVPNIIDIIQFLQSHLIHKKKLLLKSELSYSGTSNCYVHGDFTIDNILFTKEKFIVIDWSSAAWIKQPFNFAQVYWDVVWFIQSIFLNPSFANSKKLELAEEVLDQYLLKNKSFPKSKLATHGYQLNTQLYKDIFKVRYRWYQILKHKYKWKQCQQFWKTMGANT